MDPYSQLGSALSFWPIAVDDRPNIVTGVRRTAHEIIDLCLTKKGDDPLHCGDRRQPLNNYGIAPDLFDPETDLKVAYFCYSLQREIKHWVDLESVWAEGEMIPDQTLFAATEGRPISSVLEARITFIPRDRPTASLLTFPWFTYSGAPLAPPPGPYLDAIALDGEPFTYLRNR